MQAQQLGVCVGRRPFSLLLFNNNFTLRNFTSAPTSLQLHTDLRHRLQVSATLQGNVTESIAGAKLVKVKFVLQKRCEFGQQFFVVGDDELVGAWNPEAALRMEWSEGHIWTTELEVSTGKRIEFKFILVGDEGVLEWQPGPNRVLETVESLSPLELLETWSVEDQDDTFSGLEMNELSDIRNLSSDSVMNVGGAELPIPVVNSEATCENIERTVDEALSAEQSILVTEKQTVSLSPDDSHTDMAREPSVIEKDLQWARKALSMLWATLTKEQQRGV